MGVITNFRAQDMPGGEGNRPKPAPKPAPRKAPPAPAPVVEVVAEPEPVAVVEEPTAPVVEDAE